MEQLERKFKKDHIKCVSLDVFDTIILRGVLPETFRYKKISKLIAYKLQKQGALYNWRDLYTSRLKAMKRVYKSVNDEKYFREGNIFDVINLIILDLGISSSFYECFIKAEVEYEISAVLPNKGFLERLDRLKEKYDFDIILTSDMYLDKESIGKIISIKCPRLEFKEIYVSSETSYTKRSGELFDYILAVNNYRPEDVLHIGDNLEGDYLSPRNKGMKSLYIPRNIIWRKLHQINKLINKLSFDVFL